MERERLEKDLAAAEHHLARGESHIARQRDIIDRLRAAGRDLATAEELLRQFEIAQLSHLAHRERLQLELTRLGPVVDTANPALAGQLGALVRTAVEHADGKARAAFYQADAAETQLRHVIGMSPAYARYVDGFAIGTSSLACGLAAATKEPVITPDVRDDPRWKEWVWLAEQFQYRACWSFPVLAPSGKALGTFAMYYADPREASPRDLELAALLGRTAANIMACD
jgi:GAF domain-containing protein